MLLDRVIENELLIIDVYDANAINVASSKRHSGIDRIGDEHYADEANNHAMCVFYRRMSHAQICP